MPNVYATADVGSNTAHLLVAESDGQTVTKLVNESVWIGLGEKVARYGHAPIQDLARLIAILSEFRKTARSRGAEALYVFGTEALRSASNSEEVLARVAEETELVLELISARREAELSLYGVLLDSVGLHPDLLLEVGGGSAQVARTEGHRILESRSLPLGTGRLIAESGIQNPCPAAAAQAARDFIDRHLRAEVLSPAPPPKCVVASGGVARGLWRAMHPDGEKRLHRKEIEFLAWSAARLSVARLTTRFSVKKKRAGTLLPGALIFAGLMDRFAVSDIHISEHGVREGAILELARGAIEPCLV